MSGWVSEWSGWMYEWLGGCLVGWLNRMRRITEVCVLPAPNQTVPRAFGRLRWSPPHVLAPAASLFFVISIDWLHNHPSDVFLSLPPVCVSKLLTKHPFHNPTVRRPSALLLPFPLALPSSLSVCAERENADFEAAAIFFFFSSSSSSSFENEPFSKPIRSSIPKQLTQNTQQTVTCTRINQIN